MIGKGIFSGMPFNHDVRLRLAEIDPDVEISASRGRHYALEEKFWYLLRAGSRPVIAPRMVYGGEITKALCEIYGEEAPLYVGEGDLAQARGDHS